MSTKFSKNSATTMTNSMLIKAKGVITPGTGENGIPGSTGMTQIFNSDTNSYENVDAYLELQGTDGGMLFNRMTTAQMEALNASDGMKVYVTDDDIGFWSYVDGAWKKDESGGSSSGIQSVTATYPNNQMDITTDSSGNVEIAMQDNPVLSGIVSTYDSGAGAAFVVQNTTPPSSKKQQLRSVPSTAGFYSDTKDFETGSGNIKTSSGDIITIGGDIEATAGSVIAGGSVTAGNGLNVTTGAINAPNSALSVGSLSINGAPPSSDFVQSITAGTSNVTIGGTTTNPTISVTGSGAGTVTSITAGTGLNGGTITSSGTISLADTAVTAGNYTNPDNVSVNSQGQITSITNGVAPVTSVSAGSNITITGTATNPIINSTAGGTGTVTSVAITGSTGLTVGGSPITGAGTITLTLGSELQGLSGLASTGLVTRIAANTYSIRSIAVGSSNLTITNGSGVLGSPTLDLSLTLSGLTSIGVGNLLVTGNIISSTNTSGNIIVSPNGNGELQSSNNINIQSANSLKFYNTANTFYIAFKPGILTANITWTVPTSDSSGFFKSDGAGNMSIGSAVTSITAGTGLSGGVITETGTISLASTSVTAGSYRFSNIIVNAQGQLTGASSGSPSSTTSRAIPVWGNTNGTSLVDTSVTIDASGNLNGEGSSTFPTLQVSNADSTGSLDLLSGSLSLQIKLSGALSSNVSWLLPTSNSSGFFKNNGSGTISWSTLSTSDISNFNSAVTAYRLDQFAAPTANISLNSKNITNLADPLNPQEAATRNYVDQAIAGVSGGLPIGAMTMWSAETLPVGGWLECDGSAVSRITYSTLFAVLGTRWGQGDGSTTFNLPDTRGLFPRGWNHGTTKAAPYNDPDAASRVAIATGGLTGDHVGTVQPDDFSSHTHTFKSTVTFNAGGVSSQTTTGTSGTGQSTGAAPTTGGNETRPVNFSIMFIIKAL